MNVYDFSARQAEGTTFSLQSLHGTVCLIVNTASRCSYAKQLPALEALYQKYKEQGFSVLAFPCNQFGNNEPDGNKETQQFYKKEFNLTFPIFGKILVNGPQADPLFEFLKSEKRFDAASIVPENMQKLYLEADPYYLTSADIKWNFTKFLIDRNGKVFARYEPEFLPENMEHDIENLISQKAEEYNTTSEKRF